MSISDLVPTPACAKQTAEVGSCTSGRRATLVHAYALRTFARTIGETPPAPRPSAAAGPAKHRFSCTISRASRHPRGTADEIDQHGV